MNRTALYDWHVSHGGRMVDFAGWEMPIQYTSIIDEHQVVRRQLGLFDIAHMGRLRFAGPDACRFLDRLLTNDVARLKEGQIRYSLVCNEEGGILDDVLVYRFADSYMLVVNASNREKIVDWIEQHRSGFDVQVTDETLRTFMAALQGPEAVSVLGPLVPDVHLAAMTYYTGIEASTAGIAGIVSRTGYTGEDGYEIIVPAAEGPRLWNVLMQAGEAAGIVACGLGCRDTLRLEAAMPLYGHEMDERMDPFTAGLAFGVKMQAADFLGKEALEAIREEPARQKRVGLQLEGRRIAREGSVIFDGEREVGRVTSGTFSPTLEQSIAMGYVDWEHSTEGATMQVDIRGQRVPAIVVALPFYARQRS